MIVNHRLTQSLVPDPNVRILTLIPEEDADERSLKIALQVRR